MEYFLAKISSVHDDTSGSTLPEECRLSELRGSPALNSVTSSCHLCRSPASLILLVEEFVEDFLPYLILLCNLLLEEGILPVSKKCSILIPSLKHEGLDPRDINDTGLYLM